MQILSTFLPNLVRVTQDTDIDDLRNFMINHGFAVIDAYKDKSDKSTCSISYDLPIMLATMH